MFILSGCSRFSTCEFCKLWTSTSWDFAESRRSYRKRVISQLSSSTFSTEEMNHKKALSRDKKKQTAQSFTGQPGRKTGLAEELFRDHPSSLENDSPRPSLVRAAALSLRDASTTRAPARSIGDARDSSATHPGTISGAVEPPGSSGDRSRSIIRPNRASAKSHSDLSSMGIPGPDDQTVNDSHHRVSSGPSGPTGQPGQAEHSGPSSVQPITVPPGAMFEIVIPEPDTRNPVISPGCF